ARCDAEAVHVGYGAGWAHMDDLGFAWPGLATTGRRRDVRLELWDVHPRARAPGGQRCGEFEADGTRYTRHGWRPISRSRAEVGRLDIAVAPLHPTAVKRARSATKWLEHAMHATATVVSELAPYAEAVHGVTALTAGTAAEFSDALTLRCEDAERRSAI